MPSVCRRRPESPDRHDDPQPRVGALGVTPAAHLLDPLARLGSRGVPVLLDQQMCRAVYIEVGRWHLANIACEGRSKKGHPSAGFDWA
jgi:hypothetical protein